MLAPILDGEVHLRTHAEVASCGGPFRVLELLGPARVRLKESAREMVCVSLVECRPEAEAIMLLDSKTTVLLAAYSLVSRVAIPISFSYLPPYPTCTSIV